MSPGREDVRWGLYTNCAGKAVIPPGKVYPPAEHPSGYYFTFKKGRILNEYQLNYITDGEGIYQNHAGTYIVKPGSLMVTKPGDLHRYRPRKNKGWIEHYVGFSGHIANELFSKPALRKKKAVLDIGNREEILGTFYEIFETVINEKPGYQQVSAGLIMKLLGYLVSLDKQKDFAGKRIEKIIRNACYEVRKNVEGKMDFKSFAEENHVGYSYFRKMFKMYTGNPPSQYHLELKMLRAKEMLLHTDMLVKEISDVLGFESVFYFSRLFKQKMGISPTEMRKTVRN
ncbi:MAG: AraC family transcriptional regulator [Bacteroidales bacterium]|nr:AraC family transcriptional regulator [Bacteroidales bacterium]